MSSVWRVVRAVVVASTLVLEACNDGLLHAPAPAEPAALMMRAVLRQTQGGAPEAFDRADRVFVRLRVGDDVRVEQELAFGPSAAVRLEVPLRRLSETMTADLELRFGDRPLFRGSATPTLKSGEQISVEFIITPVIDRVTCGTGVVELTSYGETARLFGAALFATGDTVRTVPVVWTLGSTSVVSMSETGDVTALRDGDADATCGAAGVNAKRAIHVFAVVKRIQVAPSSATLIVGNTLPLTATLFDARGNIITSPRPMAWSSANSAVASVSVSGVATGIANGSTRISVASDTVLGGSDITVVSASTVVTRAVTGITGTGATLFGAVNPRGTPAQSWFELGTDPTLATFNATTAKAVGSGTADVIVSDTVAGLTPNTVYYVRAVASSAGGIVRGAIVSFATLRPPTATTVGVSTETFVVLGSVNPNGSATNAWFRYGTSATLATFVDTPLQSVGSGTSPVNVSQTLAGVQPATTYYVRAVASSTGGTALGNILSFTTGTAPTIGTTVGLLECLGVVIACVPNSATMSSVANPNGALTEAWFEYSSSPTLATFTPTSHLSLGSGTVEAPFLVKVGTGAPFFFRAVASNAFGTARGPVIQAFLGGPR